MKQRCQLCEKEFEDEEEGVLVINKYTGTEDIFCSGSCLIKFCKGD